MNCHLLGVAGALVVAMAVEPAGAAGLSLTNYVEIGKAIVELRTESPLANLIVLPINAGASRPHRAVGVDQAAAQNGEPFRVRCADDGFVEATTAIAAESRPISAPARFRSVFHRCRAELEKASSRGDDIVATAIGSEAVVDTVRFNIRVANVGADRYRWPGPTTVVWSADAENGTEHGLVTYRDLVVSRDGRTFRWNGSLETRRAPFGISTATFAGTVTVGRSVLQLSQLDPFVFAADGRPQAGAVEATDADGNSLLVQAGPKGYSYTYLIRSASDRTDSVAAGDMANR